MSNNEKTRQNDLETMRTLLPALLRDPQIMERVAAKIEEGAGDLDTENLFFIIERLGEVDYGEEKTEEPKDEKIDELLVSSRLVLVKKCIIESPPQSLEDLIDLVKLNFKDTGLKTPVNQTENLQNAMGIGVVDIDFASNSIAVEINKVPHVVVLRLNGNKDIVIFAIGPKGQRVPVGYPNYQ